MRSIDVFFFFWLRYTQEGCIGILQIFFSFQNANTQRYIWRRGAVILVGPIIILSIVIYIYILYIMDYFGLACVFVDIILGHSSYEVCVDKYAQ